MHNISIVWHLINTIAIVGENMYTLKGFMSMPSLALDGKNKVADFGEFSTYCQTFTRDMRNYAITAQPDVELFVT